MLPSIALIVVLLLANEIVEGWRRGGNLKKAMRFASSSALFAQQRSRFKDESDEREGFGWLPLSNDSEDGLTNDRSKLYGDNGNEEELDQLKDDDDEQEYSAINQLVNLARNFYSSLFFYGLNEGAGDDGRIRNKVLNSEDFKEFSRTNLENVFLTKNELLALYLSSPRYKESKQNLYKGNRNEKLPKKQGQSAARSIREKGDTDNDGLSYLFEVKKEVVLLKKSIADLTKDVQLLDVTLAALEEDHDPDEEEGSLGDEKWRLQRDKEKLLNLLKEKKVRLVTLQTTLLENE